MHKNCFCVLSMKLEIFTLTSLSHTMYIACGISAILLTAMSVSKSVQHTDLKITC